MQLYTPAEVPNVIQGRVCRQSRLTSVAGNLLLLTLLAGIPACFVLIARASTWIAFPVLSFAALVSIWLRWHRHQARFAPRIGTCESHRTGYGSISARIRTATSPRPRPCSSFPTKRLPASANIR